MVAVYSLSFDTIPRPADLSPTAPTSHRPRRRTFARFLSQRPLETSFPFFDIRSPSRPSLPPPLRPRRPLTDRADSPPNLRALRLTGLAGLAETCVSIFSTARLPTFPPPLRALRLTGLPGLTETCISIFFHRPHLPLACPIDHTPKKMHFHFLPPLAPISHQPRVFYLSSLLEFRFHFLPLPACRPFRRRFALSVSQDSQDSQKLAFPFFSTARTYRPFRRRFYRADLSPARSITRQKIHFHFLTYGASPSRPFLPPPHLRALRLAGLAGLTETCVSIFWYPPSRRTALSVSQDSQVSQKLAFPFFDTAHLPTFPPPHLRAFLSHQPLGILFPFFGIYRTGRPFCRRFEGFFSPPFQLKNSEFAKNNRIRLWLIIPHLCSFVNYC